MKPSIDPQPSSHSKSEFFSSLLEAATAKPLIAALNRYHDEHAVFPTHATDFVSYLPSAPAPPLAPDTDDILDWHYTQGESGSGYVLTRKLVDPGWDPTLQYHHDGAQTHWVFDPGDGSPEKTIILQP
jgi:hypothetical protein